jgi:phage-related protein (TIGR01555 family)
MKWFRAAPSRPARIEPAIAKPAPREMKISAFALDSGQFSQESVWVVAKPMPGVVPDGVPVMAMDAQGTDSLYAYAAMNSVGADLAFPGFPLLAELAQRPEYRHVSDTIAREMTRKWGEFTATGDDDKADKIAALTDAVERHNLRDKFRIAAAHDGLFGRGHIFIDTQRGEPVSALLSATTASIPRNTKLRFTNVEPIWTYPNNYNSADPLSPDFYRPRSWFVMGQTVDRSRLLTFVGRPLPDILKPAYGFAGLSMSQMAIPYVQNWLRTRQSVSDLLHSFSIMVLSTNMAAVLQGGGSQSLIDRLQLFNQTRDNRAVMAVDKDTEELTNVSAPIAGLDKLQAQAQEQMASVAGIPLVKLLGITPSGLNASSDGEIRVFYDTIAAAQETLFADHFQTCSELIQLAEFGAIDPDIKWRWNPLWQLDEAGQAAVRKTDADTDVEYIEAGVLSPLDVRQRIARDPESAYTGIDADDVPEPPHGDPDAEIEDPDTNRVDKGAEEQGGATSGV